VQLGASEKDVREAARLLFVRAEFATGSRVCQICGQMDERLISGKAS
jgi:hypothetical protein